MIGVELHLLIADKLRLCGILTGGLCVKKMTRRFLTISKPTHQAMEMVFTGGLVVKREKEERERE